VTIGSAPDHLARDGRDLLETVGLGKPEYLTEIEAVGVVSRD